MLQLSLNIRQLSIKLVLFRVSRFTQVFILRFYRHRFFILLLLTTNCWGQPPNGLRYLRVGGVGKGLRCRKNSKPEKCLKMPQNPTRQVHALLARFLL